MTGYSRGRAPLCACGCGDRTSTVKTAFRLGHRPKSLDKVFIWQRSILNVATGCINWTGALYPNGYGAIRRTTGASGRMAHRVAYETFVGPIPDGLVIDHLCRNRRCVNVTHMEAVTQGVNADRGRGLLIANSNRRARTHCVNGHEFTTENTILGAAGRRSCRQCGRERSLAHYHRAKGEE